MIFYESQYYGISGLGSPYLMHHGIKGQKWGIRRWQNSDGSLTPAGRDRYKYGRRIKNSEKSTKEVDDIINNLNTKEKEYVLAGSDHYLNREERSTIAKRSIIRDKSGKAVSFMDLLEDGDNLQVALATRTGDLYRGKGYATKATQKGLDWVEHNADKLSQKNIIWGANVNNTASIKIAEKYGFELDNTSYSDDGRWVNYVKRIDKGNGSFKSMKDTVLSQASNDPKPIKQQPIDLNIVKQRGNLTKKEAEECASIANKMLIDISKAEPKITRDIVSAVASTGGKMYGLDNRIKQANSLAAKIGSDAKEDGVSFERAASGIKDSIRYTALSTDKRFVDSYNSIKRSLESKGYTETRCKNYFEDYKQGKVMHKSVQSVFENKSGVKFEVQFQTPSSQAAKELKTPIYEESRSISVTPARKSELERQMKNLAEMVPNPSKIETIKAH